MSNREWRLWVAYPFRQWWGAYPPRTEIVLPPRPIVSRDGNAQAVSDYEWFNQIRWD